MIVKRTPHGRDLLARIMVAVDCQADLLQVVDALGSRRRLTHFLDGGDQKCDQNRNDGDDDQEFNQREPRAANHLATKHGSLLYNEKNKNPTRNVRNGTAVPESSTSLPRC